MIMALVLSPSLGLGSDDPDRVVPYIGTPITVYVYRGRSI